MNSVLNISGLPLAPQRPSLFNGRCVTETNIRIRLKQLNTDPNSVKLS